MARRRKPGLTRPASRYRRAYMLGLLGIVAALLVIAAYQSRENVIHIRVVNRTGFPLDDLIVEQGEKRAGSKKWEPNQAVALDVPPRVVVPVVVRFTSPAGDIIVSRQFMRDRNDPPLPGDSFVITVYGFGKDERGINMPEVVPEVVKDESPLRRVRWLFGW